MGSEKLCYLMHLQLEALNGQNLKINFARKLLPVARKSKRIYIFLDKLAGFVSAKLINLCFHCILALETTAPSITGAASSKTCCGKCRVQGSKHCGAGFWAVCRAPISQAMNAAGLLGYLPQTGWKRCCSAWLSLTETGESLLSPLLPIQRFSHAFYEFNYYECK